MHTLSVEDMQRLVAAAKGHRLEALILLALTTGLRRGELLALQWKDIDWQNSSLSIRRSIHVGKVSSPKSGAQRMVSLPAIVLDRLHVHRRRQDDERLHAGKAWIARDLIFCTFTGDFLTPEQLDADFQALLKQAQLPPHSFHDLRASIALLLFQQKKGGDNDEPPADILGTGAAHA